MTNSILKPILTAAVACAALLGSAMADGPQRVAPEDFAIFPWDGWTPDSQAALQEVYDCGFNLAGFVPAESLDNAQAVGLKAFVSDPLIKIRGAESITDDDIGKAVTEVVGKAKGHPALFGYHLLDEPVKELNPLLARWVKAFHEADPNSIAYINLFPNYSANPGPGGPFEDYLSSFVDKVRPKVFSYDHYALFEDGGFRDAYFPNLETARKVSMETGVPYWHVVLGNGHLGYAEPKPAGLRFQAYTSMAYGARGIGYFTYRSRERGNYRAAAIDHWGNRTPTWDMLRDVNLQTHCVARTLITMESIGVFHHPAVPEHCNGIRTSQHLKGLRGKGPFVVGEFAGESGRQAVLVVNKSLTSSTSFGVDPKQPSTVTKISSYSGEEIAFGAEQDWLAPGQGMLLILTPKESAP